MIEIYMIFYNDGYQDVPLGGYLTLEEAQEIQAEMNENNPDTEHWIIGPVEVDPSGESYS
jgi:hypothetical protein